MKFKAALFYQDTLVYYSIYHLGENFFKAKLDTEGEPAPRLLELRRYNRSWASDCGDLQLVSELGAAIEQRILQA
ncbi:hypothetical protein SAMN05444008_103167 [Cnuella takakiae]|uniref:Uncharacterized protein n=1 Tax=Cnuella takakiae TaxID=1302690 RepID=A0A1M4WWK8_9BACT|nr:hypothetical protein [Cnuella takakiae]OLY91599.1 hypothetical protein BUE76_06560 [Cnuella takakiae]SHE85580.1 hypothetical protein SAMN05444008_103167 [Cnuella takakiae]